MTCHQGMASPPRSIVAEFRRIIRQMRSGDVVRVALDLQRPKQGDSYLLGSERRAEDAYRSNEKKLDLYRSNEKKLGLFLSFLHGSPLFLGDQKDESLNVGQDSFVLHIR